MIVNTKERSFTYIRFMRDGTVEERHGISDLAKRIRTGKTARDRSRRPKKED
jgi:hypothetical protein